MEIIAEPPLQCTYSISTLNYSEPMNLLLPVLPRLGYGYVHRRNNCKRVRKQLARTHFFCFLPNPSGKKIIQTCLLVLEYLTTRAAFLSQSKRYPETRKQDIMTTSRNYLVRWRPTVRRSSYQSSHHQRTNLEPNPNMLEISEYPMMEKRHLSITTMEIRFIH